MTATRLVSAPARSFADDRTTWFRWLLFVMLLPLLLLPDADVLLAQDGPAAMLGGDAARTGQLPGPGPDPAHGVQVRWVYSVAGDLTASPISVNGRVFAASEDWSLYAIEDRGSGLWQFQTTDEVRTSPGLSGNLAVFGSNDDLIYALDIESGQERWRFRTNGDVRSSPAIVDDVVYAGSDDYNLYALDLNSGLELWRFGTDGAVASSPAVANQIVYTGSSDSNLYALDAETGLELWRVGVAGSISGSPVVAGGVVYVSTTGGTLAALDAASGLELWRIDSDTVSLNGLAIDGDTLIVAAADEDAMGYLVALDAVTGSAAWQFESGAPLSRPVVSSGVVYTSSLTGTVYAVDAESGTLWWEHATNATIVASLSVAGDLVYVASGSDVYALEATPASLFPDAKALITEDGVPLLGAPSDTAVVRAELDEGTVVTITEFPVFAGNIVYWGVIVDGSGVHGWVAERYLAALWPEDEPPDARQRPVEP